MVGEAFEVKDHVAAAENAINALQKWLSSNPLASAGDRTAAEGVIEDLQGAIAANPESLVALFFSRELDIHIWTPESRKTMNDMQFVNIMS